jgi:hypothetical protein
MMIIVGSDYVGVELKKAIAAYSFEVPVARFRIEPILMLET